MKITISALIALSSTFCLTAAGCAKTPPAAPQATSSEVTQSVTVVNPTATPTQPEAQKEVASPTVKPAAPKKTATAPAPTAKPTTQQEQIANQLAPATSYVTIKDGAFSPQVITVKAGGTVVWTNKDTVVHTTKSDGTLLWDSGSIQPGGSYRHVFKAVGTYPYSCGSHPNMHGTVYVY
ncbi:cupredoxin domain-containing protein [Candidatus Uhrbacteria bacterium]|nr:cupredoxin domain-containing protein [Candidatus Uhrbacteria bacterium]